MSDHTELSQTENQPGANTAFDDIADQFVPLDQIGVAAENLRAGEEADEDIPQLADTLFYAGQIHSLLVRPGKGRKEERFMALDGRRRRFAWLHNVELGRIPADHPLRVKVINDRKLQVAAATLPNTEQQAPDLVHVIRATGRLVKRKMSPAEIAKALGGYSVKEITGWAALADLEDPVLDNLRSGKITLRQAKLMTKLSPQDQRQLADQAQIYGRIYDDAVRQRVNGAIVTVGDARIRLAGLDGYIAAGGRVESDLFGEMPDQLLDQHLLQQVWDERVQVVVEHLKAAGLEVFFDVYFPPEGCEAIPHLFSLDVDDDLQDEVERLDSLRTGAAARLRDLDALTDGGARHLLDYLTAEIEHLQVYGLTLGACSLTADGRLGVRPTFFAIPQPEPEATASTHDAGDIQVTADVAATVWRYGDIDVPTVELGAGSTSHALAERCTDIATRGLIRTVADDPNAALILLVARLFVSVALDRTCDSSVNSSISTLKAEAYRRPGHEPMPALDGEVFGRLEGRRGAYIESGLRPIPWVAGLSHGERMTFLAELMAITLNGREFATHAPRHGARAEALELVELTGHDIKSFWIPDQAFFAAHTRAQLLTMLDQMGEQLNTAGRLKKADLTAHVTAAAGDHHWAPDHLSWKAAAPDEIAKTDGGDEDEADTDSDLQGGEGDQQGDGEAAAEDTAPVSGSTSLPAAADEDADALAAAA